MATLFMLMGLPGSGKTTLGRRLETQQPAVLLIPDIWMNKILGNGSDAERREAVKDLQLDLAGRLLNLECDVVLEFGFFSRAERDRARACARNANAEAKLIFLDPPMDEIIRRIEARNSALPPDTFPVSKQLLHDCEGWLERPDDDEPLWNMDKQA